MELSEGIDRLAAIASEPLGGPLSGSVRDNPLPRDLRSLLAKVNGLYAFESSLHVFPSLGVGVRLSLEWWNTPDLWRDSYGPMAEGLLFFAEDALGGQFAIEDGAGVCTLDPETGQREFMAASMGEWLSLLLSDFEPVTAYRLAAEWQRRHGSIPPGRRLVPRTPFVLGGAFEPENLACIDQVEGMRLRGALALQIRDLPDGTRVRYSISE